jgi:hypothetical protein
MSFTTVDIVRKHILENRIAVGDIDSEPVKIDADSVGHLRYSPVNSGSDKIKAKEQLKPDYQEIVFDQTNQVNLLKSELIRDSVVVASNSSLGHIYQENIDYTMDYSNGIIIRIPDGDIPMANTISIWYVPYRVYTRGSDYTIDYEAGTIKRIAGGAIETGQWLYVDYASEYAFINDETITNAINEANEQVLNFIDSVYSASTDRSLVVAETYLAIAIVCRIKAMWAVSSGTKNTASATWSALSDQYKKDAYLMLEKFIGSIGAFKSPRKA